MHHLLECLEAVEVLDLFDYARDDPQVLLDGKKCALNAARVGFIMQYFLFLLFKAKVGFFSFLLALVPD